MSEFFDDTSVIDSQQFGCESTVWSFPEAGSRASFCFLKYVLTTVAIYFITDIDFFIYRSISGLSDLLLEEYLVIQRATYLIQTSGTMYSDPSPIVVVAFKPRNGKNRKVEAR